MCAFANWAFRYKSVSKKKLVLDGLCSIIKWGKQGEYSMSKEQSKECKLSYTTKTLEQYIEKAKSKNISFNSFKKLLETSLENLSKPEASWTRADLIASGAKFPSPGSGITGRTQFLIPNNTFLVGYKAFLKMTSSYGYMAAYEQTIFNNTKRCKEYLYLAAYCQKCLCGWPDDDELHVATCHVSLQQLDKFLMAVIADATDSFVEELGKQLMLPERNFNYKDQILFTRGEATISLATGDYKQAYQNAERLQSVMEKVKRRNSLWTDYAQGIKAIVDKDEAGLNDVLCTFISKCRKATDGADVVDLLKYYAIGLAKLAVKNGLTVTIDTLDCPQALIQPAQMDYSHLELPKPKYGFPWEK